MSADAGEQSPLIETEVTTTGGDGVVNCAAMDYVRRYVADRA